MDITSYADEGANSSNNNSNSNSSSNSRNIEKTPENKMLVKQKLQLTMFKNEE